MKKFERRGTTQEILSVAPYKPHYQTAESRRQGLDAYEKKALELLDKEAKKYPHHRIKLQFRHGVPHFTYYQKSLTDLAVERRIKRTLSGIKQDIKANKPRSALAAKIDRTLARVEDIIWGE